MHLLPNPAPLSPSHCRQHSLYLGWEKVKLFYRVGDFDDFTWLEVVATPAALPAKRMALFIDGFTTLVAHDDYPSGRSFSLDMPGAGFRPAALRARRLTQPGRGALLSTGSGIDECQRHATSSAARGPPGR